MSMGMLYPIEYMQAFFVVCLYYIRLYIYISAWASALLVSTNRAMPEPLCVGRVTSMIPTLFFCLISYCITADLLGTKSAL